MRRRIRFTDLVDLLCWLVMLGAFGYFFGALIAAAEAGRFAEVLR